MPTDPEQHNRSSALSPEVLAMITAATGAAVREALAAAQTQMSGIVKDLALTPERMEQLKRPYQDPAKIKRELRESMKSKEDEEELRKADRARRDACLHQDANGRTAICLIHNWPDHQPRGICPICQDLIGPKEWRIAADEEQAIKLHQSTVDRPKGKAYVAAAHRDYRLVMALESHS